MTGHADDIGNFCSNIEEVEAWLEVELGDMDVHTSLYIQVQWFYGQMIQRFNACFYAQSTGGCGGWTYLKHKVNCGVDYFTIDIYFGMYFELCSMLFIVPSFMLSFQNKKIHTLKNINIQVEE